MTKSLGSSQLERVIARIVELSADAQIKRRKSAVESTAFLSLSGAILAYGQTLHLLSECQELPPEHYLIVSQCDAGGIATARLSRCF